MANTLRTQLYVVDFISILIHSNTGIVNITKIYFRCQNSSQLRMKKHNYKPQGPSGVDFLPVYHTFSAVTSVEVAMFSF